MEAEDRRRRPTKAQIDYLRELRARSDHDPDWYDDPSRMNRGQVQREIDRLLTERDEMRALADAHGCGPKEAWR